MLRFNKTNRLIRGFRPVYANNVDVFIPELWANESLAILVENMVAGNLVFRDFENVLARYGDTVHVARPHELQAQRKDVTDNVVIQDVSAADVPITLNQHIHTSFLIRDGEESKSFKSLVDEFLRPAIIAQARFIDQIVLGQYVQFLANSAGAAFGITSANAKGFILALRQIFNQNRCPVAGRNLVLNSVTETTLLNLDIFTQAQMVGDFGEALRNATLGRKLGWDFWMDQNMPVVPTGMTLMAGGKMGAVAAAGATVLTVTGFTGAVATGQWVTIGTEGLPHTITAHTETLGNTTSITISPPLQAAVAVNDAVNVPISGAINNTGGYPAGWTKEITISGFTVAPTVGQIVSLGGVNYTIVAVDGLVGVTLDRPLDAAVANSLPVNLGPAANYNFAFHRNAIALVVRPLALPRPGTGAVAAVANWNNLSMRVVITYQGLNQGHLVTCDMLAGIAVLDTRLGGVLIG